MRRRVISSVLGGTALVVVAGVLVAFLSGQGQAQSDLVVELTERLTSTGIPVKDIVITRHKPVQLEIVLQSTSDTNVVAPDDPLFRHMTLRECVFFRKQYPDLNRIKIVVVNTRGEPIVWSEWSTERTIDPDPAWLKETNNADTAELLRKSILLHGMSLDALDVSSDSNGGQVLTVELSVQDVFSANKVVPKFIVGLGSLINSTNREQGTEIMMYRVYLVDVMGQPLLKYVRDIQLSRESWWQADNLTRDWFPHPPLSPQERGEGQ